MSNASDSAATPAHDGKQTHSYFVHFPEHPARTGDPHYKDFNAYHSKWRPTATCALADHIGTTEDCKDAQGKSTKVDANGQTSGMELHHAHIEFSLQNGVDLAALEKDYPGVSNQDEVGAWVETGANFVWYCAGHHRSGEGAHTASASDFEAQRYVRGLIS